MWGWCWYKVLRLRVDGDKQNPTQFPETPLGTCDVQTYTHVNSKWLATTYPQEDDKKQSLCILSLHVVGLSCHGVISAVGEEMETKNY